MTRLALYALNVLIAISVLVSRAEATPKMTPFDPSKHGFSFSNTFHNDFVPALDIRTAGLCGGMTFAALDYYFAKMPIPTQDYRPANGMPLQSYMYNRQVEAIQISLDKWAELNFNPGGVRNGEFFRWGLDGNGRIAELKAYIDLGMPVPLGLQGAQGFSESHYVLAIGYDMGRYKGDFGAYQNEFKIFILDPNRPREVSQLIPDLSRQLWRREDDATTGWHSYFVVKNFQKKTPPAGVNPVYSNDNLVHELLLAFETGADDLRGGADNINVTMNCYDGTQQPFMIVNLGARWLVNYSETVRLPLIKPVPLAQIKNLVIDSTFGGGIGGDNWDMKSVKVRALGGGFDRKDFAKAGPYRFSGKANYTVAMSPPPPAPTNGTSSTNGTGSTTTSAPARDTTMPQLTSLYTNPGGFNYQGGTIGAYATAADNVAVQGVTLTLFKPDGTKSGIRMQKAGGTLQNSQWTTSWTVPMNTGSGQLTYSIKVDVVDSSSNILYGQKPVTFTVDPKPATGIPGQQGGTLQPGTTLQQNTQTPVNSIQNKIPSPGVPITAPNNQQNTSPAVR